MKRRLLIPALVGLAAALLVLAAAGCGEESTTTTAQQISCDPTAPSIIPPPSGKPQLVYFFRDT